MKRLPKRMEALLRALDSGEAMVRAGRGHWWVGDETTSSSMGLALIKLMLVKEDAFSTDQYERYVISEAGTRLLQGLPPYRDAEGRFHETVDDLIASSQAVRA